MNGIGQLLNKFLKVMNKRNLIKFSMALTANSIFPIQKLFSQEQNKDNSEGG